MKKMLMFWITLLVIIGSMLTVTACSGNPSASLVGTWKLISYGSPASPTPAVPDVDASVIFGSDGAISGNVGCNSFNGNYKVDGETVTFGAIASTLMACADPIAQQEGMVFNVFVNTATFKLDSNTLSIISSDGNSVVVFERK